jgi:multidrug resistance efflux pump
MKLHHSIFLVLPLLVYSSLSLAAPNCAIKEQKLREQLDYATRYGNVHRIEGLNRALANVQTYCHGGYNGRYNRYDYAPVTQSFEVDHQYQIAKKQRKVEKRKQELYEAQLKGKPSKIAKRERKLAEAEFELKQVQAWGR